MRRLVIVLAVTAVGGGMASADQKPAPAGPPREVFERRAVYSVPGMDAVRAMRNRVYARPDGQELLADVYIPAGLGADARRPAVVFIHGGPLPPGAGPDAWPKPKDWGIFRSYGELAAASGFVGVTFNHRLYSLESYDASAADVQALFEHVRTHAAELHVDPERIAAWAYSGGGPLLGFAFRGTPPWLKAVVSYYAILELPPEGTAPGASERLSPVKHLKASTRPVPPVFIARAGIDSPAINASVESFVAAALEKNVMLELFTLPEARHGFDLDMGDNNTPRAREAIERTLAFLKARLDPGR